jgi:chemotaxis protein MotB
MADDTENSGGGDTGGGGFEAPCKCPECPVGLPGWMATFADMVTLLLTFFVLLLSFAKTETAKYEAALGSIRNAFGGNVLERGEVLTPGKSPDNKPTMMDAPETIKPFPIEFLTSEGLLEKLEINRESTEDLDQMKEDLKKYGLADNVSVDEMPEGIKVRLKDALYFEYGSVKVKQVSKEILDKLLKMVKKENWTLFIEGYSQKGEVSNKGQDAYALSSLRATGVTKYLIRRGIRPEKITTLFYGDSRPSEGGRKREEQRKVTFMLRKIDLRTPGHNVDVR